MGNNLALIWQIFVSVQKRQQRVLEGAGTVVNIVRTLLDKVLLIVNMCNGG